MNTFEILGTVAAVYTLLYLAHRIERRTIKS